MKTILITCLLFLVSINFISAQTTLNAGDIAIVGINCDDPDDFAFVLLTDIEAGTIINFTDDGWFASGGFRNTEGVIAFTSPSNLSAGTVIIYSVDSLDFVNVSGSFSLSASGDQIIAF